MEYKLESNIFRGLSVAKIPVSTHSRNSRSQEDTSKKHRSSSRYTNNEDHQHYLYYSPFLFRPNKKHVLGKLLTVPSGESTRSCRRRCVGRGSISCQYRTKLTYCANSIYVEAYIRYLSVYKHSAQEGPVTLIQVTIYPPHTTLSLEKKTEPATI